MFEFFFIQLILQFRLTKKCSSYGVFGQHVGVMERIPPGLFIY